MNGDPALISYIEGMQDRYIGAYEQGLPGPLLICIGAMHGNETAGVKALKMVLKMLEVEPVTNPDFRFHGRFIALVGNRGALSMGRRFLDRDLNRIWLDGPQSLTDREARERMELESAVESEIARTDRPIVLLDLHTTTADGGIFTFPDHSAAGIKLGSKLGAPVILEMVDLLPGTCMEYFSRKHDTRLTGLAFEGGQHNDPASVNRMIAAVVSCLRAMGCVSARHIAHEHDRILEQYSLGLPAVSRVLYRHGFTARDEFLMNPGFANFDPIREGAMLAHDRSGPVCAPRSGLILMPHYQQQGSDGFFIIEEMNLVQ